MTSPWWSVVARLGDTAGMSLEVLVHEVGQALGHAQRLFGSAPVPGGLGTTGGLSSSRDAVAQANGAAARTWNGAGRSRYVATSSGQVSALDSVIGADAGTTAELDGSADASARGRSGIDTVINNTRAGVAAIAPSTDTPTGRQQLLTHLQSQLQRAKLLLHVSEQRNIALAAMIRNAAIGYRGSAGGTAMMPTAPPIGATPGTTAGALQLPTLAHLTTQTHHRPSSDLPQRARRAGLNLHNPVLSRTPGAENVRAAIRAALDIKGITDPVARANWEAGMMTVADRESDFNPNAVNRDDDNARKGDPSVGAFQMTGTTFGAYHEPRTLSDNRDLVAQAAAFINYVQGHYGVAVDGSNLAALVQQADPTRLPKGY
ncbi:hypothetical protein [Mycobacterium haemophilum]